MLKRKFKEPHLSIVPKSCPFGGSTYKNPTRQLLYLNSQTLNAIALLLLSNLPSLLLSFKPLLLPQLLLFIAQNQQKSYDYPQSLVGRGVQFYCFKVGVQVRMGGVALELLPTSADMLGIDVPQVLPGSREIVQPSNDLRVA